MGLPFTKAGRTEKELMGGSRPHCAHRCPCPCRQAICEGQHGDSAWGSRLCLQEGWDRSSSSTPPEQPPAMTLWPPPGWG